MRNEDYRMQFYNLKHVISRMIVEMFDSVLGKGTEYALEFNFELAERQEISITLYSPANYVKVIEGICDADGTIAYQCISDHDSCWRSDGVEEFVNKFSERIERTPYRAVRKFIPTQEQIAEWRKMSNDRDYVYRVKGE